MLRRVHPQELAALRGPAEYLPPALDRRETWAVHPVLKQRKVDVPPGLARFQVPLQRVRIALHVELHPERHRAGAQHPPGLQLDEGLHHQTLRGDPAVLVPPAVQIGDQRAEIVRLLDRDAPHGIVVAAGEMDHVIVELRCEPPLRRLSDPSCSRYWAMRSLPSKNSRAVGPPSAPI